MAVYVGELSFSESALWLSGGSAILASELGLPLAPSFDGAFFISAFYLYAYCRRNLPQDASMTIQINLNQPPFSFLEPEQLQWLTGHLDLVFIRPAALF